MSSEDPPIGGRSVPDPREGRSTAHVVLVGLNGSAASWNALAWACEYARLIGGVIVGVTVAPSWWWTESPCHDPGVAQLGLVMADLSPFHALLREASTAAAAFGVPMRTMCPRGDAGRRLLEVARAVHADLIVLGHPKRLRILTREVVRSALAPVILVP